MKRNNRTIFIILGVFAALMLCVCIAIIAFAGVIGGGVFALTGPARDVGNGFLMSLSDEDYPAAFAYLSPALQSDLGDAAGLEAAITGASARPTDWSTTGINVSGNSGTHSGSITFADGAEEGFTIFLLSNGGSWEITAFSLGGRITR